MANKNNNKRKGIVLKKQIPLSIDESRLLANTRKSLNGLVSKGHLLRTSRIGEHKWRATYFYRLPTGEGA